ncbi:MAG: hypothetical protein GX428_00385 [Candidatus Atribacteria bacterium]|nr:hypothetical protein [Candidatus Atribacteria bacterium]
MIASKIPLHPLRWLVFPGEDEKFPYIVCIEETQGNFFCLATQEKWPGTNKKIYCRRLGYLTEKELESFKSVDSSIIKSSRNYGKKFEIILDRKIRKRCWFIIIEKEYKTRPGEYYEQIFWVTQSAARARGRKAYIPRGGKNESFDIIIDTRERYPWRFPECNIIKENLPVGDYGLKCDDQVVAVVERKTKENLLHNMQSFEQLRASLHELKTSPYRAMIFECSYADLINPKKNPHFKPSYVADVLAEIYVLFPDIQIVFCDNRKIANEWTYRWFKRISQSFKK